MILLFRCILQLHTSYFWGVLVKKSRVGVWEGRKWACPRFTSEICDSGGWPCSKWALIYVAPILQDCRAERHTTWRNMTTLGPMVWSWLILWCDWAIRARHTEGRIRQIWPFFEVALIAASFCLWDLYDKHVGHIIQYDIWIPFGLCPQKPYISDWACKITLILADQ